MEGVNFKEPIYMVIRLKIRRGDSLKSSAGSKKEIKIDRDFSSPGSPA